MLVNACRSKSGTHVRDMRGSLGQAGLCIDQAFGKLGPNAIQGPSWFWLNPSLHRVGSPKHPSAAAAAPSNPLRHHQSKSVSTPRRDRSRSLFFCPHHVNILSNVWPPTAPRRCRPATSPQAPLILHGLPLANLVLGQSLARITSLPVQKCVCFCSLPPLISQMSVSQQRLPPSVDLAAPCADTPRGFHECPEGVTSSGGKGVGGGGGGSTIHERP